jgi:hypothetical protein
MSIGELGLLRQAAILSRECGIAPCDVHDAAVRVMDRAIRRPPGNRRGSMVHTLRMELARQLGVARRTLPDDWCGLKAVGLYEARRREYGALRGRRWAESFDRHSRHFAVENGVCPRCARPGTFRAEGGRCECGFRYT